MDDSVHVNVKVITFEIGWVGTRAVKWLADGSGVVSEGDAFFEDVGDDFGIFFRKPSVECWDSHDDLFLCSRQGEFIL